MEYRNGICASCEASYTIPASFEHDKARCRECGGTVNIGPVVSDDSEGEAPTLEEYKPSGKKRSGPSMMEQLRAQRAAAEEAAAGGGRPRPAAKPAPKPAARAAAKPAVAPGAKKAVAGKRSTSTGKGRARAGKSGGSSKRRGSSSRGKGGSSEKKKAPMGMLIGVGGIVLLLGVSAYLFKDDLLGTGNEVDAKSNEATESQAANESASNDAATTPEAAAADSTAAAEKPMPKQAAPAKAPEPVVEQNSEDPADKYNPDSVDLAALTPFGPADDTTEDEWEELQARMIRAMNPDLGIGQTKEWKYLEARPRKAFPAIVNYMLTIDYTTEEGTNQAKWAGRIIENITNGNNFGFKEFEEDSDRAGPTYYAWYNKGVAAKWHKAWAESENDLDYWGLVAKLNAQQLAELKQSLGGGSADDGNGGEGGDEDEPSALDLLNDD